MFSKPLFNFFIVFTLAFSANSNAQYAFNKIHQSSLDSAWELKKYSSIELENNGCNILINNTIQTIQLLVFQKNKEALNYEKKLAINLKKLDKLSSKSPYYKYIKAELYFQSGLVNLLFENEWTAAFDMLKSYRLIEENAREFPDFVFNFKTLGLFHVLLSAVPEKYYWILETVGIKHDFEKGMKELEFASKNDSIMGKQAALMYEFCNYYFVKKSATEIGNIDLNHNPILAYFQLNNLSKNGKNEQALLLSEKHQLENYTSQFPFFAYLLGNIYLKRGDFNKSDYYFRQFLSLHKGKILRKDSFSKLYISAKIQNDQKITSQLLDSIKSSGNSLLENDKKAQKNIQSIEKKPITIIKATLFFDGGFYQKALDELENTSKRDLENTTIKQEYFYRKARVFQQISEIDLAITNFNRVLDFDIDENYFAPNACLQLGKLYLKSDKKLAKKYLDKCLNYSGFEYENSIKTEAKAELKKLTK